MAVTFVDVQETRSHAAQNIEVSDYSRLWGLATPTPGASSTTRRPVGPAPPQRQECGCADSSLTVDPRAGPLRLRRAARRRRVDGVEGRGKQRPPKRGVGAGRDSSHQPGARRLCAGPRRRVVPTMPGFLPDLYRSAGFFAIAVRMTLSSAGGIAGFTSLAGVGSRCRCACMRRTNSPSNGGWPVASRTARSRASMSLAAVSDRSPVKRSGAMYMRVPTMPSAGVSRAR